MFPSIFLPFGVHILSISSSPLRMVYCWRVFLSMFCDKDRWEQGSGVCSDFWMNLFWYLHCKKKMFIDCYMFSEVIPNTYDWLLFCGTQKKVGKVAFFLIQSMSVGTIGMSIWLPTFKKKSSLCSNKERKNLYKFLEPRERVFIFGWTIHWLPCFVNLEIWAQ